LVENGTPVVDYITSAQRPAIQVINYLATAATAAAAAAGVYIWTTAE